MVKPLSIPFTHVLLASLVILLAGSIFAAAPAPAPVTVELISSTTAVTPGTPFTVAACFKIQKEWHIYWKFSGDAGLPPEITWKLPAGWSASDIDFPVPTRFTEKGPLTTYGYRDSVLLFATITPPASIPESAITVNALVTWMACHEECLPGKANYSLTLPVRAAASLNASSRRIRDWQKRLPKSLERSRLVASLESHKADDSAKVCTVTLTVKAPKGISLSSADWFPNPVLDYAVKNIAITPSADSVVVTFAFQSYKGPIAPYTKLESLLVYKDASGRRRGLTLFSPISISN